jgi:hypothetical protein
MNSLSLSNQVEIFSPFGLGTLRLYIYTHTHREREREREREIFWIVWWTHGQILESYSGIDSLCDLFQYLPRQEEKSRFFNFILFYQFISCLQQNRRSLAFTTIFFQSCDAINSFLEIQSLGMRRLFSNERNGCPIIWKLLIGSKLRLGPVWLFGWKQACM